MTSKYQMINTMKKLLVYLITIGLVVMVACKEEDMGNVLVASITIAGEYIEDAGTSQMTAIISPSNATNKTVNWSVSDESIATISESGLLTAVSNGNVTVTATAIDDSGVSKSRIIGVSGFEEPVIMVESITVSGDDVTNGTSEQYTAEILPVNAENREIIWSVSDEALAEISEQGLLFPKQNGTVLVIASATDGSGVTGERSVNISGVPDGTDGTVVNNASDFLSVISSAAPGDKIYLRAGTYEFSSRISFSRSGTEEAPISLFAYPQDEGRPLFDFSSMSENSSNRGIQLSGDHWHVKGLDVYGAGDNGMFISGHNNLVEFCTFFENADTGLQIGNGASNNTVLNCDSYYNADSSIENADGFACKLDAGDGNGFIGCRAWQNLDDGWDGYLRGSDNITTTHENCWAIRNGQLKDGSVGGGDGNGFKTGGSDDKLLKHHAIYKNCIAAGNVVDGFDHNSNRGDITLYNCGAHDNGRNINFGTGNIANSLIIKNTVTIGGEGDSYNATTTDLSNNSWQGGLQANSDDYSSLDIDLLISPRNADGSLPDIAYMKLQSGSDLIDAGTDVGLDYTGSAPDIGPFEFEN